MRRTSFSTIALLAALALILGCAAKKPVEETAPDVSGIRTVLVLPLQDMTGVFGQNQQVRSPLSGKMFFTGEVGANAPKFLFTRLWEFMDQSSGYTALPPGQTDELRGMILGAGGRTPSEREIVPELGRRMEADAVLAGYVYRYKPRMGNAYAVETPASVAFELCLVRSADGAMIWSGRYDETQQALSENLLKAPKFLERGGKWVSAEDLAAGGLSHMLKDFPKP
ncbi:MAG: hypothetical protein KKA60_13680 [Proteobacteria bacterium]|nr:hypothetical protein [Pseudomonadota bacterium]